MDLSIGYEVHLPAMSDAFVRGCEKAKLFLTNNQYPKNGVEWQIGKAIDKVYHKRSHPTDGLDKEGKKLVPMAEMILRLE